MAEIHLVRHGQASFLADEYDELSPLGHEQARLLGVWWRENARRPDRVLHGGMKRHRQTAHAFLGGLGLEGLADEAVVDFSLDEFDHVDVVSRLRPELTHHAAIARWVENEPDPSQAFQSVFREGVARWTGGSFDEEYREPWPVFRARCECALERAVAATPEGSVTVVVTSGGPISVALHRILGMPEEDLFDRSLLHANTGTTQLRVWDGGTLTPGAINETTHLLATRRPELVTYR